jgi:hypothetical protein
MLISKRPLSFVVFIPKAEPVKWEARHRFYHFLSSHQFPNHALRQSTNNHGALSTLYSRVPSNYYSNSYLHPRPPPPESSSPPILLVRRSRPHALRFPPFRISYSPPASRMFVSTERLSSAWRHTPMKWNPLPWFVGALLLVLIQYRRHRAEKEVHVDEDGHEVIRLKGPWQVSTSFYITLILDIRRGVAFFF